MKKRGHHTEKCKEELRQADGVRRTRSVEKLGSAYGFPALIAAMAITVLRSCCRPLAAVAMGPPGVLHISRRL